MATKKKPVEDERDQSVVRWPPGVRKRIAKAAEEAGRSMNAEIVAAMVEHLDQGGYYNDGGIPLQKQIDELKSDVEILKRRVEDLKPIEDFWADTHGRARQARDGAQK